MASIMKTLAVLLVLAAAHLFGQAGTDGSILGVVTDQGGAAVSGAQVRVTNVETGVERSAVSSDAGAFEVLALPRGSYRVVVSAQGFNTWQMARVDLQVAEQKRLSPSLRVGDVKQEVTVEAGAAIVQTERASVETAIEEKQIRDMPLNGRNPIELVTFAPGMRFLGRGGLVAGNTVQGGGIRDDQAGFTVDGLDANDPSTEVGIAFPNVDTIAQFNVQTSNFSAENGRNPLQVAMVTKSGTNSLGGTLWQFHRNAAVDARNTFALTTPKLIRNQFGYSLGGPMRRNKLFHFSSYEGTRIRQERIYNSNTPAPGMLTGDFGSRRVNDPATNAPFPNNRIPADRISPASRFFFPYLLAPNGPDGRFRALAPVPADSGNFLLRADAQLAAAHSLYARWIYFGMEDVAPGYRPDYSRTQSLGQHNTGLNYNWTLSPRTLVNLAGGFLYSNTTLASPQVGKENLTANAGIQGFPTAGRENAIGLPNATITGYPGFSLPAQIPARFRRQIIEGKGGVTHISGKHTLGFGYQYNDRRTLAIHTSASPRGTFNFNGQYTGDGFADYLMGLTSSNERNYPLNAFGMGHSPYSALYLQDYWKVTNRLTINAGLRWDFWHQKALVRNSGATFLPSLGKVVAATDAQGRVDLTSQTTAPFLAAATRALWITAADAKIPRGLFESTGFLSPRLGGAWRLRRDDSMVLRAGYGIYTGNFNGNVTGSQIIGPPYWTFERLTFARASLQRWETSFPADPRAFIAPSVTAAAHNVRPMKVHEWNVALQALVPGIKSAVTLSYVGNRGAEMITRLDFNEVPPGRYTNLQAAKPYPAMGTVRLYDNAGRTWYNALQLKAERRFQQGFAYILSYAFSRNTDELGSALTDGPTPFSPKGYEKGRSELERRHVLTVNGIWEIPVGRGRRFGAGMHRAVNGIAGGWQMAGIYNFISGSPLSFLTPGATLGNGFNTRPNLTGDPRLPNPTPEVWFNAAAFAAPPQFTFGNAGLGLIDGPGQHNLNLALQKNFPVSEERYFQFRWELFNAPNHVNYGNPLTTLGQPQTARITTAEAARQMQFGLKFVF